MTIDTKKRLVIAIDCDDVVVESSPSIVAWYNKQYGTTLHLSDLYKHDADDLPAWGVTSRDEAINRVNEYLSTDEYAQLPPTREAIDTLVWLGERHELHLVTGRADFLESATRQWLVGHFGDLFVSLEFTNFIVPSGHEHKSRSKADVCKQLGADILIDDHLHHAEQVAQADVPVILFGDYPWNQADELSEKITRLANWSEVREYFER